MRRTGWLIGLVLTLAAPVAAQQTPLQARYANVANRLITAALKDSAVWNKLATLTGGFGYRISGSDSLERALDWILAAMKREGLDKVREEPVMVPHWVRGNESAELVSSRRMKLPRLGLGNSVGTPSEGITTEVLSDGGVFQPIGFGFSGSDSARALLRQIVGLLKPVGADSLLVGGGGADIGPIMQKTAAGEPGVPGISHLVDGSRDFWFHHTDADTMDKLDPRLPRE